MSRIERQIAHAWARKLRDEIVTKVIADLKDMEAMLSGDDSGLANVWEEVCAQVQGEESHWWDLYQETVKDLLAAEVENLHHDAQLAMWIATAAGSAYVVDYEEDPAGLSTVPLDLDDIVRTVAHDVMEAAANYDSPSLYRYLWDADDPESADDEGEYDEEEEEEEEEEDGAYDLHQSPANSTVLARSNGISEAGGATDDEERMSGPIEPASALLSPHAERFRQRFLAMSPEEQRQLKEVAKVLIARRLRRKNSGSA